MLCHILYGLYAPGDPDVELDHTTYSFAGYRGCATNIAKEKNSKFEARQTKQIRISNFPNSKHKPRWIHLFVFLGFDPPKEKNETNLSIEHL